MRYKYFIITIILPLFFCLFPGFSQAQVSDQAVKSTIIKLDSLFWQAYNTCDVEKAQQFFAEDVTYYHEHGGSENGVKNLMALFKKNLCSNDSVNFRSEATGDLQLFLLKRDTVVYGMMEFGESLFYLIRKGRKPKLVERGKFEHIWLLKDGVWKIQHVFGYGEVSTYTNQRKEIELSNTLLEQLTGQYLSPKLGIVTYQKDGTSLLMLFKDQKMKLFPETNNKFFIKDRDLLFEFQKNKTDAGYKVIALEEGEVVDEMTKK